jgi:hypothetical protein
MRVGLIVISSIIFSLAMFRLLPHWPNVSPVAAMALFGGAYFADRKLAFVIPFAALLLSDLFLGFHGSMVFVYTGFAITVMIGFALKRHISFTNTAMAAVASSLVFFLLTNFGSWLTTGLYPQTATGLLQAIIAGIPFFQYSLLGNLAFTAVIFGGYAFMQHRYLVLKNV